MPFINGAQVSVADGRVQMTTSAVAGADSFLGGLRYDQITLAIRALSQGAAFGPAEYINAATTPPGGFGSGFRLGMTYRMTLQAQAIAARFWRIFSSNLTSRTLVLYDTDSQAVIGTTVATVESPSNFAGWVEAVFSSPIALAANQKVTISYNETGPTHAGKAAVCPVVNAAHATFVHGCYGAVSTFPQNIQLSNTYYADLSVQFVGASVVVNDMPTNGSGQLLIDSAAPIVSYRNGLGFTALGYLAVGAGATPVVSVHGWPIAADGRMCVNLI